MKWLGLLVGLAWWCVGCSGDFTLYNEIDRLRVLAVKADRPWLRFSETASISALVVQAKDADAELTYEWSWCPLTRGAGDAYQCAFTEEEVQAQIDAAVGPGVIEVPPFALGSAPEASFTYELSPLFFSGLCEQLGMQNLPDFVVVPKCEGTFPITVRLVVSDGEREITAVKEIELVYDDAITEVNTNPRIDDLGVEGSTTALADPLERDVDVKLTLDVSDDTIEQDGEMREEMVVTWFIESGELDRTRTAFIEGEVDTLRENVWHTPRVPDWPEGSTRFFLVARDNRRGVSWIERTLHLKEPE